MEKKLIALVMGVAFTAATVVAASAFTCVVKSVDGGSVTLDCKAKYTEKLKTGGKVKVRAIKKKVVEGC